MPNLHIKYCDNLPARGDNTIYTKENHKSIQTENFQLASVGLLNSGSCNVSLEHKKPLFEMLHIPIPTPLHKLQICSNV